MPTNDELIDEIAGLKDRLDNLRVSDLPKAEIMDWLEQDWRPNSDIFQLTRSVGGPSLWSPPSAQVSRTTDFTPTAGAWTAMQWSVENFDTDEIFSSAANTRLTCRTEGLYYAFAQVTAADAGARYARIRKNGNDAFTYGMASESSATSFMRLNPSAFIRLEDTDYLETMVFVPSGVIDADTSPDHPPRFGMVWIGNVPKGANFDA